MSAAALVLLLHCAQQTPTEKPPTTIDGPVQSFPALITTVGNTLTGWGNLEGSVITDFPEYLQHHTFTAVVPTDYRIAPASAVNFQCPNHHTASAKPCDVFVFYYHCEHCESGDGGLPAALSYKNEWNQTACAPTFQTRHGGAKHKMTGWRTTIMPGQWKTILIQQPLQYAMFAMQVNGRADPGSLSVRCNGYAYERLCHSTILHEACLWDPTLPSVGHPNLLGRCVPNTCPDAAGCAAGGVCVRDEVPYTPLPTPDPPTNPQAVGLSARVAFLAESMPAWDSIPGSLFVDFPRRYVVDPFVAVVPREHELSVPDTAHLTFDCPFTALATPCDVVVFFFYCAGPCEMSVGGLDSTLLANGYVQTECAPKFTTGSPTTYPMVGYVKTIQPGAVEEVPLSEKLDFALFGLSYGKSIDCGASPSERDCTHSFNVDSCEWNDAAFACETAKCGGRPAMCTQCPKWELDA